MKTKLWFGPLLGLMGCVLTSSCEKYDESYQDSLVSIVTVSDNGDTTNETIIPSGKDSFYLKGVLYRITNNHIEVFGYDDEEFTPAKTAYVYSAIKYNGHLYQVTRISDHAFEYCRASRIELRNGITSIGKHAFRFCGRMRDIILPTSLTTIEDFAFMGCEELQKVRMSDHVTTLGIGTFMGCKKLAAVDLSDALTSIPEQTFNCCESLKEIELPNGVTEIGNMAFERCLRLSKITMPNKVSKIGNSAFYECI